MREKSGLKLCREKLGVEAEFVLDPTLLIDRSDYLELLNENIKLFDSEQKIFTYILDNTKLKTEVINEIAKKLNLKTYRCQPVKGIFERFENDLENYEYPPVESWINSFRVAEFVITDSFHGCVFSIIFQKPFLAIGNFERGYDRFVSLLSTLGLEDRLITQLEKDYLKVVDSRINWNQVNNLLDDHKKNL